MSVSPVQISTSTSFAGTLSATTTLTGVTAGNTIVVVTMHVDLGGNSPVISVTDGTVYTTDATVGSGGASKAQISRLAAVSGGTHTIVVTASTGTASQSKGRVIALELPPVVLDEINTGGGSGTAASVAATATLAGIGELAIAGLYYDSIASGGGTFPPVGGPGVYTEIVSKLNGSDAVYQVLSTAAGVGVDWGTFTVTSKWAAAIAVYAAAVPPDPSAVLSWPKQTFVSETIIQI